MVVTRRLTRRQPYDQGLGKPFVFLNQAGYEILISRAGTLGGGWLSSHKVCKSRNFALFLDVCSCEFHLKQGEMVFGFFWNDLEALKNTNSVRGCHNLMFCFLFDLF